MSLVFQSSHFVALSPLVLNSKLFLRLFTSANVVATVFIFCAAAYLQTGQVVAPFSPLPENRLGVTEGSEEPNAAPGYRRLHLHIGRHAAVPDGL